jgi:hypothetical protein
MIRPVLQEEEKTGRAIMILEQRVGIRRARPIPLRKSGIT